MERAGASVSMSSQWGSLHPDLIAQFIPCNASGEVLGAGFLAPIKEGSVEHSFNWTSPFEEMRPESKSAGLLAGLQSGVIPQVLDSAATLLKDVAVVGDAAEATAKQASDLAKLAMGRTGITKINSRQVFNGNAPIKITASLLFRAYQDPRSEVTEPFTKLLSMAYPAEIAADNLQAIEQGKAQGLSQLQLALLAMLPSQSPNFVSFTYKGETYKPLVIESVSKPLDAPYSMMGELFLEVPITLATLTSWDGRDITAMRNNSMGQLVDSAIAGMQSLFK
ncbi:hypothetical protein DFR44_12210 [Hydromonas duriensis]|uniref:Uncharacterized protein n=2 Tax=Hydromonas duriensis TaxID=1527608 RepID=A0A4R6Y5H9_9BURK|nr:hypothetical protein DFR44_12210 [Hydromonas duriensis]